MGSLAAHYAEGAEDLQKKVTQLEAEVDRLSALRLPPVLAEVAAERRRHVVEEGWTPEHDDCHSRGEMAEAAIHYAGAAVICVKLKIARWGGGPPFREPGGTRWPWSREWWKPGAVRRMLIKACALLVAEIERLDRAEANTHG